MGLQKQVGTQSEKLTTADPHTFVQLPNPVRDILMAPQCIQFPATAIEYQREKVFFICPVGTIAFSSSKANPPGKTTLLLFDGDIENFHRMWCSLFGYHRVTSQMYLLRKRYKHDHSQRCRTLGQTMNPTSEGSISGKRDPRFWDSLIVCYHQF